LLGHLGSRGPYSYQKTYCQHKTGPVCFQIFFFRRLFELRMFIIIIECLCSNIYPTRCNVTQFILSGNCSTCFGWYYHPSSGAHTTVSTASGICHTVTATCRHRGRVGTGLSVLWVAYATHSIVCVCVCVCVCACLRAFVCQRVCCPSGLVRCIILAPYQVSRTLSTKSNKLTLC
jgi:hypothetical protein